MKSYEVYLTDDQGRRITLLNNISFLTVSRTTRGFGTIHLGIPFADFKVFPYFLPDRRVEVWRTPRHGETLRDEGVYLLRKFNVYTREEDNVQIIEFWGRTPIDILRRGAVTSTTLADYQKTDEIDDMMKDIVLDSLITPAVTVPSGEMTVDGSDAQGPIITHSFFGQNILDILNDLRDISFTKHEEDSANKRIYFDVMRGGPLATGGYGFIFRTYAEIRGTDRRNGTVFSLENGNLTGVSYYEDHLDSFTQAQILNLSTPAANGLATSPDATLSRWNTIISTQQSSDTDADVNDSKAFAQLQDGKADNAFNGTIIDSPGSDVQPRSLYGVDWDLGDILPVRYADKDLEVEVKTVYLSIDENANENIVGMCELRDEPVVMLIIETVDIPMSADTPLISNVPTSNFDTSTVFGIGEWNGGVQVNRTWIKPDFSSIPAGALFISAVLKMTPVTDLSNNARIMSAHRCLRDVVSTQATWNIWKTANNWGTAGCSNSSTDYDGAVVLGTATQPASPTLNSALSFTMTLDAAELQKLFDGTYVNNGIILFVATQADDEIQYASREHATPGFRPVITIEYSYEN